MAGPWRKRCVALSIEVAAPPSRVWQYLVDVSIWPRYYVDLEDVKVSPAGPLQVASRITSRRRVPLIRPTAKASDLKMELQSVVTELVPGVSYTLAALDRQAATKTEVTATSSGSRIDVRTQLVLSVGDSIAGQLLRWPAGVAQFKANSMRSLERLKELLLVPSYPRPLTPWPALYSRLASSSRPSERRASLTASFACWIRAG